MRGESLPNPQDVSRHGIALCPRSAGRCVEGDLERRTGPHGDNAVRVAGRAIHEEHVRDRSGTRVHGSGTAGGRAGEIADEDISPRIRMGVALDLTF